MAESITLPQELSSALGAETQDFAVKAERALPVKKCASLIILGLIWTAFMSMFVVTLLGPLLMGQEATFKVNGVPTTVSPGNLAPMLFPGIVISVLTLVGLAVLAWGVVSLFREGGYYVGTVNRLLFYKKGNLRSMDWKNFSGDIDIRGNNQKGDISLRMSEGKMQSSRYGRDRYVADMVYLAGIPNVFEIEKMLRQRIKEHSPAPVAASGNM
jgi:hypothetical protein